MKYLKIFVILATLLFTNFSLACNEDVNNISKSEISTWLGDNSLFSKAYKDGKCVLDKALVNIPIEQRKTIAKLIAKSYGIEAKKLKELTNYNY
tara:strand:- start:286 stop:567 length:282 start_codon:yes stop_codon:yes gene_type:complete